MDEQKIIGGYSFQKYALEPVTREELLSRSAELYRVLNRRRSVRQFSDEPVPREAIENIIMTASTAPSGAHQQPWTFCAVADPALKKKIREEAEKEELTNYQGRMSDEWLEAIKPLQTDWQKPYLETAPFLIVVFKKAFGMSADGGKKNHYYVNESVGIATGFLLAAIHQCGLASLVHTPSPMNFLTRLLNRPDNERAFLLIPVGYPAPEAYVPCQERRPLSDVAVFY